MKNFVLIPVLLLLAHNYIKAQTAQPGTLDLEFGNDGIVTTDLFNNTTDVIYDVTIQQDGKIIAGGYTYGSGEGGDLALVRYNADGTLDNSFGNDGKVKASIGPYDEIVRSLVILNDGKIVTTGYYHNGNDYDFLIARFNLNGTIDSTFGNKGSVITQIGTGSDNPMKISQLPSGKLIVAGNSFYKSDSIKFALAQYNADGSMDYNFSDDGILTSFFKFNGANYSSNLSDMTIQPDGKIIISGSIQLKNGNSYGTLIRLNSNGSLDQTFGDKGEVVIQFGTSSSFKTVKVQPDSKIICSGNTSFENGDYRIMLVRLNNNGTIDLSFGENGIAISKSGHAKALIYQPDGKYVEGSDKFSNSNWVFTLTRHNSDGSLDISFGTGGSIYTEISPNMNELNSLAMQKDGKIVAAGYTRLDDWYDFALVRYYSYDGPLISQTSIYKNELHIYPNPVNDVLILKLDCISTVNIIDVNGRIVLSKDNTEDILEIPMSNFLNGIYFINITSNKVIINKKIVVSR